MKSEHYGKDEKIKKGARPLEMSGFFPFFSKFGGNITPALIVLVTA